MVHDMYRNSCSYLDIRPNIRVSDSFSTGAYGLGHLDEHEYLDIAQYGEKIIKECEYIKRNHQPPERYLSQQSPSSSSTGALSEPATSPTSAGRNALRQEASGETDLPLDPQYWKWAKILGNYGSNVSWQAEDGQRFNTPRNDWKIKPRDHEGKQEGYFVYIQPNTHDVYWNWTLQAETQEDPGPPKVVAGPSSANTDPSDANPGAGRTPPLRRI